jgi:hypothetical protein
MSLPDSVPYSDALDKPPHPEGVGRIGTSGYHNGFRKLRFLEWPDANLLHFPSLKQQAK